MYRLIGERNLKMNRIFIASDWHLYQYDKETGFISKNPNFDEIIKTQNELVKDDDEFIFLGDLVDSEINDEKIVYEILRNIRGHKTYFIRGNNDCFSDDVYEHYFRKCVYALYGIQRKILISHTSVDITKYPWIDYNIHGHIHRKGWDINNIPYYHPCEKI